jgi:ferredoxin
MGISRLEHWVRRTFSGWYQTPWRRLVQSISLLLYLHLLFYVAWPFAGTFSPGAFAYKEWLPVEVHLWLDPLLGLSAAIAARCLNVALWGGCVIFLFNILLPRGFCSYLCPLGSLIDVSDWFAGRFIKRSRQEGEERWQDLRFWGLITVLAAAVAGVQLAGHVAAIPLMTRGLVSSFGRLQFGALRGWEQVGAADAVVHIATVALAAILFLSLHSRRFWCRLLCPSGALLSCVNLVSMRRRHVETSCTGCAKCLEACAFDAILPDFSTRRNACTTCRNCAALCPVDAITFDWRCSRKRSGGTSSETTPEFGGWPVSRRALLASISGGLLAAMGVRADGRPGFELLRPPGSLPEKQFLQLCIRCGECFKVCPGPVLHPSGFSGGLDSLWTPIAVPVKAGCHPECNLCTQVCPTGAVRPLSLEKKRRTCMGQAKVDRRTCLPFTGKSECRLCFDECAAAGYNAIEMRRIRLDVDLDNVPEGTFSDVELEEMTHIDAPFVDAKACVGCGLCEYRCHAVNVRQAGLLQQSAVVTLPASGRGIP